MKTATLQRQVRTSTPGGGVRGNLTKTRKPDWFANTQTDSVLVLCPRTTKDDGVVEAIYALYYLPQKYKLVVDTAGVSDAETAEMVQALSCQASIMDRIVLRNEKTEMPDKESPFLFADVVLYGANPMPAGSTGNPIVVFDLASANANRTREHNVTVADKSPEAIASAILDITRVRG